jgi:hypothetical protein
MRVSCFNPSKNLQPSASLLIFQNPPPPQASLTLGASTGWQPVVLGDSCSILSGEKNPSAVCKLNHDLRRCVYTQAGYFEAVADSLKACLQTERRVSSPRVSKGFTGASKLSLTVGLLTQPPLPEFADMI